MRPWANLMVSAATVWSNHGPPGGHRQHPIRVDIGQLHAICITYLLREIGQLEGIGGTASGQPWAISRSSTVCGYEYGPTLCYRQQQFGVNMGHQEDIGSIQFVRILANSKGIGRTASGQPRAISRPSAVSKLSQAWPIACHRHHLPLKRDGPTRSYRQDVFGEAMGHQQFIDSMQMWTNPMLSAVTVWSNHGPPGGNR